MLALALALLLALSTPAWAIPTVQVTRGTIWSIVNTDWDFELKIFGEQDFAIGWDHGAAFEGIIRTYRNFGPVANSPSQGNPFWRELAVKGSTVNMDGRGEFSFSHPIYPSTWFEIIAQADNVQPGTNVTTFTLTGSTREFQFYGSGVASIFYVDLLDPRLNHMDPRGMRFDIVSDVVPDGIIHAPEPSTWLLLLSGIAGLLWWKHRYQTVIP